MRPWIRRYPFPWTFAPGGRLSYEAYNVFTFLIYMFITFTLIIINIYLHLYFTIYIYITFYYIYITLQNYGAVGVKWRISPLNQN